jgi:hypothetical protein
MKRSVHATLGILILSLVVALPLLQAAAAGYNAPLGITGIMAAPGGQVYIKFAGVPNPGPCGGNNYGWVLIPSTANAAMKSLAESLYFNRKPVRVETLGCSSSGAGPYELVNALYAL